VETKPFDPLWLKCLYLQGFGVSFSKGNNFPFKNITLSKTHLILIEIVSKQIK